MYIKQLHFHVSSDTWVSRVVGPIRSERRGRISARIEQVLKPEREKRISYRGAYSRVDRLPDLQEVEGQADPREGHSGLHQGRTVTLRHIMLTGIE